MPIPLFGFSSPGVTPVQQPPGPRRPTAWEIAGDAFEAALQQQQARQFAREETEKEREFRIAERKAAERYESREARLAHEEALERVERTAELTEEAEVAAERRELEEERYPAYTPEFFEMVQQAFPTAEIPEGLLGEFLDVDEGQRAGFITKASDERAKLLISTLLAGGELEIMRLGNANRLQADTDALRNDARAVATLNNQMYRLETKDASRIVPSSAAGYQYWLEKAQYERGLLNIPPTEYARRFVDTYNEILLASAAERITADSEFLTQMQASAQRATEIASQMIETGVISRMGGNDNQPLKQLGAAGGKINSSSLGKALETNLVFAKAMYLIMRQYNSEGLKNAFETFGGTRSVFGAFYDQQITDLVKMLDPQHFGDFDRGAIGIGEVTPPGPTLDDRSLAEQITGYQQRHGRTVPSPTELPEMEEYRPFILQLQETWTSLLRERPELDTELGEFVIAVGDPAAGGNRILQEWQDVYTAMTNSDVYDPNDQANVNALDAWTAIAEIERANPGIAARQVAPYLATALENARFAAGIKQ
jgi:hypothetical protein